MNAQAQRSRAMAWLFLVALIGTPAACWLLYVPSQAASVQATCEQITLSSLSPFTLSFPRTTNFSAHGFAVEILNVGSASVDPVMPVPLLPENGGTLILRDGGAPIAPALAVDVVGRSGPFVIAFGAAPQLATLRPGPKISSMATLEITAPNLMAQVTADTFRITPDRLTWDNGKSTAPSTITVENLQMMVLLRLRPAHGRALRLSSTISSGLGIDVAGRDPAGRSATLDNCKLIEIASAGRKIELPSMQRTNISLQLTQLRFTDFRVVDESDLSLRLDGALHSAVYGGRELLDTNLARLGLLPLEKQGLFGLILILVIWVAKPISERIRKALLDRIAPEGKS